jgi:hypothetical protein
MSRTPRECTKCHEKGHRSDNKKFHPDLTPSVRTKNATNARNGNASEKMFCNNAEIKQVLETYLRRPIKRIRLETPRKKSDIIVEFEDGSCTRIQNKDGKGNNRGWSADRRGVQQMPLEEDGKTLLYNVCLKGGTHRPTVENSASLTQELLLGAEKDTQPDYFTHTEFDHVEQKLIKFSIGRVEDVMHSFTAIAYPRLEAKRTCVHISSLLYLQRKGGGKTDARPNDIQLKLKAFPDGTMHCIYDGSKTT